MDRSGGGLGGGSALGDAGGSGGSGAGSSGGSTTGAGGGLGESLGDYLRAQRRAAQLSLRQLAERAEVSNPYLSQVERGLRQPSAQVLNQIARGLRISTHALYVRAGLLADELHPDGLQPDRIRPSPDDGDPSTPDQPGTSSPARVRTAVQDDPHLLDRHKLLLLDLYETFRRDAAADLHPTVTTSESLTAPARSTP